MTKNEKPQQKNYVLSEEQRNTLLQYLANRPFIEVQKIINLLENIISGYKPSYAVQDLFLK